MSTPSSRFGRAYRIRRSAHRLLVLSALLVTSMPFGSSSAVENPSWFLLRNHETGTCWPSLLLSINGQYQHAFAQKAGGPYGTEAEALKRREELRKVGTCT